MVECKSCCTFGSLSNVRSPCFVGTSYFLSSIEVVSIVLLLTFSPTFPWRAELMTRLYLGFEENGRYATKGRLEAYAAEG